MLKKVKEFIQKNYLSLILLAIMLIIVAATYGLAMKGQEIIKNL
jgi:uncharacterized membrane protein